MSHILISRFTQSGVPALETSSFSFTEDDLANLNSAEYFCARGHSFAIGFEERLTPPAFFECACTRVAANDPEAFNPRAVTERQEAVLPEQSAKFEYALTSAES